MSTSSLIRTRFAPTPSGYLHVGNAWSFLLTWLLARSQGGSIHLRIDDLDAARFREEYLEDIFHSLHWLGLDWDSGPKSPSEFHDSFSQRHRRSQYRSALEVLTHSILSGSPRVYACGCSRDQIKRSTLKSGHRGIYPGTCRNLNLPIVPAPIWQSGKGIEDPNNARVIRLYVPGDTVVTLCQGNTGDRPNLILNPAEEMGDIVLWQKSGEASYQLASVVDDEALGINWVVRGRDLMPSSGVQTYLAELLGAKTFASARFYHHGLFLSSNNEKLSKSSLGKTNQEAFTLKSLRQKSGGREILLGYFSQCLGMGPDIREPAEMLSRFKEANFLVQDLEYADFSRYAGLP
jgi:glutamyl/glutaminyl-tRNA synthetase